MAGEDLGAAVRLLRGDRTQAECAVACGLDATTWSFYETGRRRPKATKLSKVLEGLGCSRLELEKVAWTLRRENLKAEENAERPAGSPVFVEAARKLAGRVREVEEREPLRKKLRELLSHIALLVEEALLRLHRSD